MLAVGARLALAPGTRVRHSHQAHVPGQNQTAEEDCSSPAVVNARRSRSATA
jgi:hypothetical protein